MWPSLKIAAVQYPVTGGLSFAQFSDKFESRIAAAARGGAQLVVFPELFSADLFRGPDELADIARIVAEETPRLLAWLPELSRRHGVSVLAGSWPRETALGIVNTAPLAFPDGRVILQDKLFLTQAEWKDWHWVPGTELKLIDAPWGRTVISICYDTEIPALSSRLAEHRPELLLIPSCTGGPEGFRRVRWTAQARAIEHYAYAVHTGTVGPGTTTPNMNTQYGQAAFITPSDTGFEGILAQGPLNEDAVVHAELDLARLRAARPVAAVYPARDQCLRQAEVSVGT
jgi:predicted amidohydrolase